MVNKFLVPVVRNVDVAKVKIYYSAFDKAGVETLRLQVKPKIVLLDDKPMKEMTEISGEGFKWTSLRTGGVLTVSRTNGNRVAVIN